MSKTAGYICDVCGRNLVSRPVLLSSVSSASQAGSHGLVFSCPPDHDICDPCQRGLWLALGRERGWRATAPRKAAGGPAVTPAKTPTDKGKRGRRAAKKDAAPEKGGAGSVPAPENGGAGSVPAPETPAKIEMSKPAGEVLPWMRPASAEEAKEVVP